MIYKELDRSTIYVKELYFREVLLADGANQTALEQMLDYGYVDSDLRFLCRNGYIEHSTYIQAFHSFAEKP
jgi:hypothetical protein